MVRTDIFSRGVPWMILLKRTGTIETDLNVKADQKACVVLTGVTLLAALACLVTAWAGVVALAGLAAIVVLNRAFLGFLVRRKGLAFACAALPLHLIYYCCCGLSVVIAQYYWYTKGLGQGSIAHGARDAEPIAGRPRFPGRRSPAGRAGYRAGGRDRNNRPSPDRETFASEAAHENWHRWKLPLESARLRPLRPAALGALAEQPAGHQFTVFVDRTIGGKGSLFPPHLSA